MPETQVQKWQPTPVLLPGEFHGQRSLVGCSPWGLKRVQTQLSHRSYLHCGAWASHCGGFSCCGAQSLGHSGFGVTAHRLRSCRSQAPEPRLSSGPRASLLHNMWDLPRPEIEVVSSALADGYFTTEPPGKPPTFWFY